MSSPQPRFLRLTGIFSVSAVFLALTIAVRSGVELQGITLSGEGSGTPVTLSGSGSPVPLLPNQRDAVLATVRAKSTGIPLHLSRLTLSGDPAKFALVGNLSLWMDGNGDGTAETLLKRGLEASGGILNVALEVVVPGGEQCDIGIACADPSLTCNQAACLCEDGVAAVNALRAQLTEEPPEISCTDSDNGKDAFVPGITRTKTETSVITWKDTCLKDLKPGTPVEKAHFLFEGYCELNTLRITTGNDAVPCEDGCENGACVKAQAPVCGDGRVQGNEQCEDSGGCQAAERCSGCVCVPGPLCGNGKVEDGEACESDTECSDDELCTGCICTPKARPPFCGDGILQTGEACESAVACPDSGICALPSCQCIPQFEEKICGNGVLDTAEDCELGRVCPENFSCSPGSCTCEPIALVCGNGIVEEGEACETDAACGDGSSCVKCSCVKRPAGCGDGFLNPPTDLLFVLRGDVGQVPSTGATLDLTLGGDFQDVRSGTDASFEPVYAPPLSLQLIPSGNLFVTESGSTVHQLLAGTIGEPVLRLQIRSDLEDTEILSIAFASDAAMVSVEKLLLFLEGTSSPFAEAVPCASQEDETKRYCASPARSLLVPRGQSRTINIQPVVLNDASGGVSGETIALRLPGGAIRARGLVSDAVLLENDGDDQLRGEIVLGTPTAGPDQPITGPESVVSGILLQSIAPVPGPSPIPAGRLAIGGIAVIGATHDNERFGLNKAVLTDVIFTVHAVDVTLNASEFSLENPDAIAVEVPCTPFSMNGDELTQPLSGDFLVRCSDLKSSGFPSAVEGGGTLTLLLQGAVMTLDTTGSPSLIVELTDSAEDVPFGLNPGNSHIRWVDSDLGTEQEFTWVE